MKKIFPILTLTIAVLLLSGCSYKIVRTDEVNGSQQVQVNKNDKIDKSTTTPSGVNIATQKCSVEAKKVFDTFKPFSGIDTYSYKNHYNSNGTCYVLVHGFGEGGQEEVLLNAYENQNKAQCELYSGSSKMSFCVYSGVNEKYDLDKFNNFIKQYMEN
jgi:uncharacterized protein YceK